MPSKDQEKDNEFGGWTADAIEDADDVYVEPDADPEPETDNVSEVERSPREVTHEERGASDDPLFSGNEYNPEDYRSPPPDNDGTPARSGRGAKKAGQARKMVYLIILVGLIAGGGYGYRHYIKGASTPPQQAMVTPPAPSRPAQPSQPSHAAPSSNSTPAHTSVPSPAQHPSPTAVQTPSGPTPSGGANQANQANQASGPSPVASAPPNPAMMKKESSLLSAVGGIKGQLSTLETQLASQRKHGVSKKDLSGINKQITALKTTLSSLEHQVGNLSNQIKVGSPKHPVLSGYKLLDVVGNQAVIEDLSTGHVATLKANGGIGSLSVYQVSPHQVVTNYGVFSVND